MTTGSFSKEALEEAWNMMYTENPLLGKCNQKKLREQNKKPRTPAQQAADQKRAQTRAQQNQSGSGTNRSEAAKKAAETRRRCKGGASTTPTPSTPGQP